MCGWWLACWTAWLQRTSSWKPCPVMTLSITQTRLCAQRPQNSSSCVRSPAGAGARGGPTQSGRVNPPSCRAPLGQRGGEDYYAQRKERPAGGPGWPPPAHLSSASFFAMGQGLLRMVVMSFFFSSTCSRIWASSSSDRDSPPEALEAKEGNLEDSQGEQRRVKRR